MFKKGVCLVVLAAMAFSLIACSGNGSGNGGEANDDGAQWPRNVEIVVPAGAGGDTDFNARLLADKLSQKLEPNFVVSNVSGEGGGTGTRQVKNAANDGSSVLFYHSAFVVNELSGTTDYGFESYEFACIAAMNPGNVVTVSSSLGVNSLEELFEYSQQNPGELRMAAQTGATSYAVSMLLKNAGLDVNIVDAGSAAERMAALLGGHVDIILAAYGSIHDYVEAGDLVPLALDSGVDLDAAGLKSIVSEGYDIKLPFYYFFAFPEGTDQDLVDEFSAAVKDIVENDADYAQKIGDTYLQTPTYYNASEGLEKFREVYDILADVEF
jgi:tripartite-type tricarboxylate transporter receptor subunit TctC